MEPDSPNESPERPSEGQPMPTEDQGLLREALHSLLTIILTLSLLVAVLGMGLGSLCRDHGTERVGVLALVIAFFAGFLRLFVRK